MGVGCVFVLCWFAISRVRWIELVGGYAVLEDGCVWGVVLQRRCLISIVVLDILLLSAKQWMVNCA